MLLEAAFLLASGSLRFAPAPAPRPISGEIPVSIPSHDGWTLRGRLAYPNVRPRATVVLLHGSGPIDMDETMPPDLTATGRPEKLFKQLSDRLVAEGFAVLRYHKRGVTDSGFDRDFFRERLVVEDLVADGATAVEWTRRLSGIGGPVILLGHSEGTMLAPLIAARVPVAGMILLGAMARPLDQLVREQIVGRRLGWLADFGDRDGDGMISREELRPFSEFISVNFDLHDDDRDGLLSRLELRNAFEAQFRQQEEQVLKPMPWYKSHLALRPNSDVLPSFRGPIAVAQGGRDGQTPPAEALALQAALRSHPDASVRIFDGLDHGFAPPRDGWKPTLGPIDPAVLDWIAAWAAARW